jgi:hypothetical protein
MDVDDVVLSYSSPLYFDLCIVCVFASVLMCMYSTCCLHLSISRVREVSSYLTRDGCLSIFSRYILWIEVHRNAFTIVLTDVHTYKNSVYKYR